MIELRCKNCNSKEMRYLGGIWVCNACGSNFIPEENENPPIDKKEEKLVESLVEAYGKFEEYDPIVTDNFEKWERLESNVETAFKRLKDYNPNNAWLFVVAMLNCIRMGFKSADDACKIVYYAGRALELSNSDDLFDIKQSLEPNFMYYKDKLVDLNPILEEQADRIADCIMNKRSMKRPRLDYDVTNEYEPFYY